MSDLRLNTVTGDLDVTDFTSPRLFTVDEEINAIAQRVTIRLRTFLGEWFMDTTTGIPWWQQILAQKNSEGLALAIIRDVILSTPGIVSITSITGVLDADRLFVVTFSAVTEAGTINLEVDPLPPVVPTPAMPLDTTFVWAWRANNFDGADNTGITYGAAIGAVPANLGTGGAWDTLGLTGVGSVVVDDAENVRFLATGSASGSTAKWNRAASAPAIPSAWAIGVRVKTQSGVSLDDYLAGNSGGIWMQNSRVPKFGFSPTNVTAPSAVTDDVWHTLIVGWNGSEAFLYVDGVTTTAAVADPGTAFPAVGEFGGPLANFAPGDHYRMNRGAVGAYADLASMIEWLEWEV